MESSYFFKVEGLTVRDILANTVNLYRERFLFYSVVLGTPILLLGSAEYLAVKFGGWWPRGWQAWGLAGLNLFVGSFSASILIYAAIRQLRGTPLSASDAVRAGLSCAIWVFMAGAFAFIGIAIGFLLLVVPGLIALCSWFLALPVAAMERIGPLAATEASFQMTRGYRLHILAVLVLLQFATFLIEVVVQYTYWLVVSLVSGQSLTGLSLSFSRLYLVSRNIPDVEFISGLVTLPVTCLSLLASAYIYAVLTSVRGPYANRDYVADLK
ncbi:hypothetical protein NUH88_08680 [Nisaea acidiphila]|uniref:Glycerophosphoryl diester phosphodiesterase membrane domain-containing protein n=1 Tax=Nisaea acidiphila TaxID=1862145 RepID=A0A9J7AY89_9PROT|nr:hypothetical protein [Nisaea acidiphila]UUX51762.1 hypothetical protein NUH88_08680 [Nisaea acidiphila]